MEFKTIITNIKYYMYIRKMKIMQSHFMISLLYLN